MPEKRRPGRPKTSLGRVGMVVTTKIPPVQYAALTEVCSETGLTQASIVRTALAEWLTRYKRRSPVTPKALTTGLEPSS